jgi:hypothetical protein
MGSWRKKEQHKNREYQYRGSPCRLSYDSQLIRLNTDTEHRLALDKTAQQQHLINKKRLPDTPKFVGMNGSLYLSKTVLFRALSFCS